MLMSKKTIICLWWLKEKNFKIIVENLSLKLKIGVLKILILMSIRLNGNENLLKIRSQDLLLDSKVIVASLYWLSSIKVVTLIDADNLFDKQEYLVKYSFQENELRKLYEDCWVELPTQKILNFIKKSPSSQKLTYEAICNYLMMVKGNKMNSLNLKRLYYDEEYMNGNYIGTWRELLIKYDLVEFLDVSYVDIY